MTQEIELKGHLYSIGELEALKAFHVTRRLAPVLEGLVAAFRAAKEGNADAMDALAPVAEAMAGMPDDQADYIIRNSLSVVKRSRGEDRGWDRVTNGGGGLMFEDIDMPTMLMLVWKVLEVNLKDFFSELPSLSAKAKAAVEST